MTSGNTQRRTAHLLGVTKNTVHRKIQWLRLHYVNSFNNIKINSEHIQIDEMETIEHTKLKPLSIPLCVDNEYKILSLEVARIPAKGRLAKMALKKYGKRQNEQESKLRELFEDLKRRLNKPPLTVTTDSLALYSKLVREYFPTSLHIKVLSRDKLKKHRELLYEKSRKKIHDPLFALNQRCAMLRADIRRLTRRSWCTTKKVENLKTHLLLYQHYHNQNLC